MWGCEQDPGAVLGRAAAEREPVVDRRRSVVPGRDHVRVTVDEHDSHASGDLGPQVELEIRCDGAQLAKCPRLELAHALTRDAEARAHFFQGLRRLAVETETKR